MLKQPNATNQKGEKGEEKFITTTNSGLAEAHSGVVILKKMPRHDVFPHEVTRFPFSLLIFT